MSSNYELWLISPDFELLYNSVKTLECQLMTSGWEKIKAGQAITVRNNLCSFSATVVDVTQYFSAKYGGYTNPLFSALIIFGHKKFCPALLSIDATRHHYQQLLDADQIAEHGLVILGLQVTSTYLSTSQDGLITAKGINYDSS